MAVDIRADATCSIGPLISASISDDYVQGTGLIKTRGNCVVKGLYTPNVGSAVTFSYTKNGSTRQIPRKLRVLSSFADPCRQTTTIELGCKLTYLADKQEPIDWTAFDDPANANETSEDAKIITLPISAASVMDKCLTELGITANSNPLTNKFSVDKFDLGPGYVTVLSDLLVSESYCGYLDADEQLNVFSLDASDDTTGPVIVQDDIVDLGSIGVGPLPAETVVVSYSTLKLNTGNEDPSAADWDTVSSSNAHTIYIPYTDTTGTQQFRGYNVLDKSFVSTTYQQIIKPNGEVVKVPRSRRTIETTGSVAIVGSLVTDYLKNGMQYYNQDVTRDTSEFFYYDEWGNETLYISDTLGALAHLAGDLGINQWVFTPNSDYVQLSTDTDRSIEYIVRRTYTVGEFQRVITESYGPWTRTIAGQQAIAAAAQDLTTSIQVNALIAKLFPKSGGVGNRGLFSLGVEVSTQRRTEGQIAPTDSSLINAANASGGDPSNGYRTESSAELELAIGSATAQRRIEFRMPYAPDDTFIKNDGPPVTYNSEPSDAAEKANLYGRVQNRLLLGNRSGMNLQLAPEKLPTRPFAPFVVSAGGASATYRTNGTSWQLSSDGVLVSVDALFWGGAGATPGTSAWFPTAPGITELPPTPTITNTAPTSVIGTVATVGTNPQTTLNAAFPSATSGQGVQDLATDEFWKYNGTSWVNVGTTPGPTMTVTSVVPVWNETVLAVGRTSTKLQVTSLPYALSLLTEVAVTTQTALVVTKILKVEVPAADVTVAGGAPAVSIGVALRPPAADVAVAGAAPAVSTATVVQVPAADVVVVGAAPTVVASLTVVLVPAANVTVSGATPDLQAGDDYYTNLATQFFTLLRDWRVDWWGD
jgi:hypothetical protein